MKRAKTSRTVVVTSAMAMTIALGGGMFAHSVANADPAANPSGQTDNAPTINSHKIKPEDGVRGLGPGLERYSDELTSVLGVSADELKEAHRSGSTIAQIATTQNVDVQTVIDQLVTAEKTELQQQLTDGKITQTQYDERAATITQRVTDLVNGNKKEVGAGGRGRGGFGGPGAERYAKELTSILGVTTEELKEAREAGSTIAEIAATKNVDVQTVIDTLVTAQKAELQQQLTDGKITQSQFDEREADITQRVTDLVNGKQPEGPAGHIHDHGARPDGEAKTVPNPNSSKVDKSPNDSIKDLS
ncbi:hypothetical protein [Paenibacillus sp. FSL R5-0519]|uniref:hypothetical protein n=1 Tax=Paenibacillus sp. FSL R5-0519 TaxID=2921648 RepID=UPI0030DA17A9